MYRRRRNRNPFANLLILLVMGGIAGLIYVWYDNRSTPSIEPIFVTPIATVVGIPLDNITPSATSQSDQTATPQAGLLAKAELFIPAASVSAPVIDVYLSGDSWDVTQLGDNVGHLQGTAWLDAPGNVVLSGHVERRSGKPGIFASISKLAPGDQVIVLFQGEERVYVVSETRTVDPDDLTPLYPTDTERLTLITCDSYDFFSAAYQKRVVVVAERTAS